MANACEIGKALYHNGKRITEMVNWGKTRNQLAPKIICKLQQFFPRLNLQKVRWVEKARIPRSGWRSERDGGAITFGYTIYFADDRNFLGDKDDLFLLIHELVHVDQYRRLGNLDETFACEYYVGYAFAGYNEDANPMEMEADFQANRVDLDTLPKCEFNGEVHRLTHGRQLQLEYGGPNFRTSWDLIVAGEFGGSGGKEDLFFYDRTAGYGEFYRIDPNASRFINLIHKSTSYRKSWDIILS